MANSLLYHISEYNDMSSSTDPLQIFQLIANKGDRGTCQMASWRQSKGNPEGGTSLQKVTVPG